MSGVENNEANENETMNWRRPVATGLIIVAGLALSACKDGGNPTDHVAQSPAVSQSTVETSQPLDLLDGTWHYMDGVDQQPDKLVVHRTGEAILTFPDDAQPNAHNSRYIPNPPVNLFGTHLEMDKPGNVSVTATLQDMHGSSLVSLESAPPVMYDEDRVNQPGIDVRLDGDKVTLSRWAEAGEKAETKSLQLSGDVASAEISLRQEPGKVTVNVDGQQAEFAGDVFKNQVWFGLDGDFTVAELAAAPLNGNNIAAVDMSKPGAFAAKRATDGLASIAKRHGYGNKMIGTAVDPTVLVSDPEYTKFIINNFNEIETEMIAKPQALQPERGKFEFNELDGLVKFAEANNLTVVGHTLVFNEANPAWMVKALHDASPDEARQIMKDHIQTVMSRYDGKHGHGDIKYWDVVNEPFDPDNWGQLNKNNIWYKAIGPSYIADAIRYARQANPNAGVGINDWALETDDDRRAGMLELLSNLKKENALPDYIGIQAHIDEDTMSDPDAVRQLLGKQQTKFMNQVVQFGVKTRYSEISVAADGNQRLKAAINAALVRSCFAAPSCFNVNYWGATNQSGRDFYFTGSQRDGDPGNDAPTSQQGDGPIKTGATWLAIKQAAANKF
ncbi:MAG TPA: endo-1,4-beta-xylanase [Candidatus Saccharimonadales bacterium]|nr:endo-1,4-beta-xylanase [Candidatus Saccharimonadales bacterium]